MDVLLFNLYSIYFMLTNQNDYKTKIIETLNITVIITIIIIFLSDKTGRVRPIRQYADQYLGLYCRLFTSFVSNHSLQANDINL